MIRILCIVSSLDSGGAETFLMKLSRALDRSKFQMDFISSKKGVYDYEVITTGGKVFYVPLRTEHPIRTFISIYNIVKANNYKYVLKLSDTSLGVYDLLAAKCGGAKRVGMRSCNSSAEMSLMIKLLVNLLKPLCNLVCDFRFAPSVEAATFTFGKNSINKVVILKNGLDSNVYAFNPSDRMSIRNECKVSTVLLGHIGRFVNQKNHLFLLEIFKEVLKHDSEAKLLLLGEGPLKETIKNKIKTDGIEDSVIIIDQDCNIAKYLSAMDVFVLPSLYEGLPNVIVESQANGLPCLISDSISKETRITELVNYESLSSLPAKWAQEALELCKKDRQDVSQEMKAAGFDINDVKNQFIATIINDL